VLKVRFALCPLFFFFWGATFCFAASDDIEWYISNGAGMMLEKAFPLRALRSKNALSMQTISEAELPAELRKYYAPPWKIMCSVLFEDGKRIKSQWVFRDETDTALFVASIGDNGAGFIEWYNDQGYIIEEQRLDSDGAGFFISYTYKDNMLLKAESHIVEAIPPDPETTEESPTTPQPPLQLPIQEDEEIAQSLLAQDQVGLGDEEPLPPVPKVAAPKALELARNPQGPATIPEFFVARTGREGGPLWTDTYRYTRTASLRSVERVFHVKENNAQAENSHQLIRFPRSLPKDIKEDETNGMTQPSGSTFLSDVLRDNPAKAVYKTDNKHRVITETRIDENGEIIGEVNNLWKDDRLTSVTWTAKGEDMKIEYRYNKAGDRIGEEDFRNGILERSVQLQEDGKEIENLYIDGQVILSAIWEDGRKISEERFPIKNQVKN
jgi:hypothetical protein